LVTLVLIRIYSRNYSRSLVLHEIYKWLKNQIILTYYCFETLKKQLGSSGQTGHPHRGCFGFFILFSSCSHDSSFCHVRFYIHLKEFLHFQATELLRVYQPYTKFYDKTIQAIHLFEKSNSRFYAYLKVLYIVELKYISFCFFLFRIDL
jgi:hypothetical protein